MTLVADVPAGSLLSSWTGCTTVSPDKRTCTVTMTGEDGDRELSAVDVRGDGEDRGVNGAAQGTITSTDTDPDAACNANTGTCVGSAPNASTVTLVADVPGARCYALDGVHGGLRDKRTCTVFDDRGEDGDRELPAVDVRGDGEDRGVERATATITSTGTDPDIICAANTGTWWCTGRRRTEHHHAHGGPRPAGTACSASYWTRVQLRLCGQEHLHAHDEREQDGDGDLRAVPDRGRRPVATRARLVAGPRRSSHELSWGHDRDVHRDDERAVLRDGDRSWSAVECRQLDGPATLGYKRVAAGLPPRAALRHTTMSDLVKVTLPDGSQKDAPKGQTVVDFVKTSIGPGLAKAAYFAKLDGEPVDLSRKLDRDAKLEVVTTKSPEALEVARHDAAHVMASVVQKLYRAPRSPSGPRSRTASTTTSRATRRSRLRTSRRSRRRPTRPSRRTCRSSATRSRWTPRSASSSGWARSTRSRS